MQRQVINQEYRSIKITFFHKKNKLINRRIVDQQISYINFIRKIIREFTLSSSCYYHLYYEEQNQKIAISSEEHFFIYKTRHTFQHAHLFLEVTQVQNKHFLRIEKDNSNELTNEQINDNLQKSIQQKKEEMIKELILWKKDLEQKVRQQCQKNVDKFIQIYRDNRSSQAIHKNIACNSCQSKDIVGIRYECALCNYNLCQSCQRKNKHGHPANHPFICIRDQTQRLAHKDNRLVGVDKNYEENRREIKKNEENKRSTIVYKKKDVAQQKYSRQEDGQEKQNNLQGLMDILTKPREECLELMKRYPNKTLHQLVNLYYEK